MLVARHPVRRRAVRCDARGFTLVELITAVAVMAILATLAVPSFRQYIGNQRTRNAAYDLVEVSIKTSPDKAIHAQKEFDAHLRKLGLDPEGAQETKTRTALEYFAKTHRQAKS